MVNFEELQTIIRENRGEKFIGTTIYGEKNELRLFVATDGSICEFNKGSHKWGHQFDISIYESIVLKNKKTTDDVAKARRYLTKVSKYLSASGLWCDIKKYCDTLLSLDDEKIKEYLSADWDKQHEIEKELGIIHVVDYLAGSIKNGIKSINYEKWHDIEKQQFADAIKNKKDYSFSWRKGYDNSISCKYDEKKGMLAWYSEEFKDCGNGHYYLALDEKHAIFCEDD